MSYRQVKIHKDPHCAVCGVTPTVTELIDYEAFCGSISTLAAEAAKDSTISVRDLKSMLDARDRGEDNFVLIDVREPVEFEIVAISWMARPFRGCPATGESCCTAKWAGDLLKH